MERFVRDFTEHRVDPRQAAMVNDVSLTRRAVRFGQGWALTTCYRLEPWQRTVGIATMLQVIKLHWEGMRFRFRFPVASDDYRARVATARARRDYRLPYRRALRELLPDSLITELIREERDDAYVCELVGIGPEDLATRMVEWRMFHDPCSPIPF